MRHYFTKLFLTRLGIAAQQSGRLLLSAALLAMSWSSPAQACKCDADLSIKKEQYDRNNLILIGKILSFEKPGFFKVGVLYEIKGEGNDAYEINFYLADYCDGIKPQIGTTYLILARIGKTQIMAGGCGGVKELSPDELDLVKLLQFKQGE